MHFFCEATKCTDHTGKRAHFLSLWTFYKNTGRAHTFDQKGEHTITKRKIKKEKLCIFLVFCSYIENVCIHIFKFSMFFLWSTWQKIVFSIRCTTHTHTRMHNISTFFWLRSTEKGFSLTSIHKSNFHEFIYFLPKKTFLRELW